MQAPEFSSRLSSYQKGIVSDNLPLNCARSLSCLVHRVAWKVPLMYRLDERLGHPRHPLSRKPSIYKSKPDYGLGVSHHSGRERDSPCLTTYWSESTLSSRWFGGPASCHGSLNPGSRISTLLGVQEEVPYSWGGTLGATFGGEAGPPATPEIVWRVEG